MSIAQGFNYQCFEFLVPSLGRLFFSDVSYLVIDEADSMFDKTFKSETMELLEAINVSTCENKWTALGFHPRTQTFGATCAVPQ